jgi:hypothetical protein
METTAHDWRIFDARTPVLTYEYSFGPGLANALAVGGKAGLVVVSPPLHAAPGVFDDLAQYGPVRALVASNAFHYLGIPEWKARFPDAAIFAPAQSIARVERRTSLADVRPLSEAGSITGPALELIDTTTRGVVWYVTDVITNMPELPQNPIARFVFRVSGSAPGPRFNNIAPLFMVRDKAALRRWLCDEFRRAPPAWMIATHGDVVDFAKNPEVGRTLFAAS